MCSCRQTPSSPPPDPPAGPEQEQKHYLSLQDEPKHCFTVTGQRGSEIAFNYIRCYQGILLFIDSLTEYSPRNGCCFVLQGNKNKTNAESVCLDAAHGNQHQHQLANVTVFSSALADQWPFQHYAPCCCIPPRSSREPAESVCLDGRSSSSRTPSMAPRICRFLFFCREATSSRTAAVV